MDLIEQSLQIALNAYRGQTDKTGETYTSTSSHGKNGRQREDGRSIAT